eukprot:GGOE01008876.1.p1 GENE.GGOE01008876.1~~GGOE01008876.1.p1  ORF type:complete len:363 (-),score=67.46 GGOE01008876.1:1577-2587(-)
MSTKNFQKVQSSVLLEVETIVSCLGKPVHRPQNFCPDTKGHLNRGGRAGCLAPFQFLFRKLQPKKAQRSASELQLDSCNPTPMCSTPPSPDSAGGFPSCSFLTQLCKAAEAVLLTARPEPLALTNSLDNAVRDVLERGMVRGIKESCLALRFGQELVELELAFKNSIRNCIQTARRDNIDQVLANVLELSCKAEEQVLANMKNHLLTIVCALQQSTPFAHLIPVKCPDEPPSGLRGLVPHTMAFGAAYLVVFTLEILANLTNVCCQATLKLRDKLKERAATGCRRSLSTIPKADSLRRTLMLMRGTYTNCVLQSFDQSLTVLKAGLVESLQGPDTP